MSVGFNPNKFIKESKDYVDHKVDKVVPAVTEQQETKPKRGRKKKESSEVIVPVQQGTELNYLQSDISYMTAYKETNEQLDSSINELNMLGAEVMNELRTVKGSKTLKNKYGLINDMSSTVTNIINTKISAIKEKNKVINDANSMDLRRMKELKISQTQEDDNTRMMNLYDAFVNTQVGTRAPLGPSLTDMTLYGGAPTMDRVEIGSDQSAWEQSLDPVQNRMLLEAKGAIKTVVFYDENSGNRWFEVVDINTGQPVPNVEKPDASYIYELDINRQGGYARDSNRNVVYDLIIVNNGDTSITDY